MGCQCAKQPSGGNMNLDPPPQRVQEEINKTKINEKTDLKIAETNNAPTIAINDTTNQSQNDVSTSKVGKKGKKTKDYPKEVLDIINQLRTNPQEFAKRLEEYAKDIVPSQKDPSKFDFKGRQISKGPDAFVKTAEIIKNQEPVGPLEMNDQISEGIDVNDDTKWKEIKEAKVFLEEFKKANSLVVYGWKETVPDAESAIIIQSLDDKRRKEIINKKYKCASILANKGKVFRAFYIFGQ